VLVTDAYDEKLAEALSERGIDARVGPYALEEIIATYNGTGA
jgi:hypothetical protein